MDLLIISWCTLACISLNKNLKYESEKKHPVTKPILRQGVERGIKSPYNK